jgi:hypothetical protein
LAGHLLSLNQGYLLGRAVCEKSSVFPVSRKVASESVCAISFVGSLLKSLSPVGRRLAPMLAISAQGILFSLGLFFFGTNPIGITLAIILLSLWGFLQPLLLMWVIYGRSFFDAWIWAWTQLSNSIGVAPKWGLVVLLALVVAKLCLAVFVAACVFRSQSFWSRLQEQFLVQGRRLGFRVHDEAVPLRTSLKGALQDLFSPFFLISIGFTILFALKFSESHSELLWVCARPIGLGFLIFWFLRAVPIDRLRQSISRYFPKLGALLATSLRGVDSDRGNQEARRKF